MIHEVIDTPCQYKLLFEQSFGAEGIAQHFSHSSMFVFIVLVDDIPRSIYAFEEELGVLETERLVCFAKSIAVFYGFGGVET
jgi:hypothetical protein